MFGIWNFLGPMEHFWDHSYQLPRIRIPWCENLYRIKEALSHSHQTKLRQKQKKNMWFSFSQWLASSLFWQNYVNRLITFFWSFWDSFSSKILIVWSFWLIWESIACLLDLFVSFTFCSFFWIDLSQQILLSFSEVIHFLIGSQRFWT